MFFYIDLDHVDQEDGLILDQDIGYPTDYQPLVRYQVVQIKLKYPLMTSPTVRKISGSILGLVKSDGGLPAARHRGDVSSNLCCPGAMRWRWTPPLVTRLGVIPRV